MNARFEVRGRRGLPLGDATLVAMYSDRKKKALFRALINEFGVPAITMAQEVLKQQISLPNPVTGGVSGRK